MEVNNEKEFFQKKKHSHNLLICDEKDRPFLLKKIEEREGEVGSVFDQEHSFSSVLEKLNQPSLFVQTSVIIILSCEQYSEEQWQQLFSFKDAIFYFFISSTKKSYLLKFKGKGATLNLLQEKPWERKNRFIADTIYLLHKKGVQISQPTAHRFIDTIGLDLSTFDQEKKKLIAFCSGKEKIVDSDIDAIFSPALEENGFKITEEIVWNGKVGTNFSVETISGLLQIIGAFRFQAHLGLKILSKEEVKMPPWQVKKYREKSNYLGEAFFLQMLKWLLEAELLSKQSNISPSFLYALISMKIVTLHMK